MRVRDLLDIFEGLKVTLSICWGVWRSVYNHSHHCGKMHNMQRRRCHRTFAEEVSSCPRGQLLQQGYCSHIENTPVLFHLFFLPKYFTHFLHATCSCYLKGRLWVSEGSPNLTRPLQPALLGWQWCDCWSAWCCPIGSVLTSLAKHMWRRIVLLHSPFLSTLVMAPSSPYIHTGPFLNWMLVWFG